MNGVSRRAFLGSSAAGAAGLAVAGLSGPANAQPESTATVATPDAVAASARDPRYDYLNSRGLNRRFVAEPVTIFEVFTPEQTRQAVQQAVTAGQQIAVRSGGHCLDGLVDTPQVQALIDVSRLNAVYFDPTHRAFVVESGALLGDVYKQLYGAYGVVIPGGTCPTVGVGGYVQGGGFGALCRQYGLIVDHLYGIEVVVVDAAKRARLVLATREPNDPNRELWWAHTGSGGGNFGVVTRYLFRSPGATGTNPSTLLPAPPAETLVTSVSWPSRDMSSVDFQRLLGNHGAWHAANSAPGSAYASLYSALIVGSQAIGTISLVCEFDGTLPNADALMDSYVAAVGAGVSVSPTQTRSRMPWLSAAFANLYGGAVSVNNRSKGKGAYLRKPYTTDQFATMYRYLSDPTYTGLGTMVIFSYGGQVNTVPSGATAAAQRDSVMKSYLTCSWATADQDAANIAWVRSCYRDIHAATGGVPVPDDRFDGSYINYPDIDLSDPAWNTSGVPWSSLYFKQNYQRLQQIKAHWDPGNIFRHPLSVQLPS